MQERKSIGDRRRFDYLQCGDAFLLPDKQIVNDEFNVRLLPNIA